MRSLELGIIENVWRILIRIVYAEFQQFKSLDNLQKALVGTVKIAYYVTKMLV